MKKIKLRDEAGFTKKAGDDLKRICKEADMGVDVSKTYYNAKTLINDLRKNAVKY